MPWKVKATAWNSEGPKRKTVLEIDDDEIWDRESVQMLMYWVRNMEPGEKVVVKRFHPGYSG